jgi:uncharacterized OB-fold protein|nr:MAG TPA: PROTEIN/RNA Complex, archaeal, ribosomal, 50S, protein.0A [Caudoviricetes sp.]
MPYYTQCPQCGANLDPGERCEACNQEQETAPETKDHKKTA